MSQFLVAKIVCIIGIVCLAGATVCQAQSFTSLMSFDSGVGGQTIASPLNQGVNGDLMGLTALGGAHQFGTTYEITPFGKEAYSYSFCSLPDCGDGEMPYAQLLLASDGTFYGTASGGGGRTGGRYGLQNYSGGAGHNDL